MTYDYTVHDLHDSCLPFVPETRQDLTPPLRGTSYHEFVAYRGPRWLGLEGVKVAEFHRQLCRFLLAFDDFPGRSSEKATYEFGIAHSMNG